jgi:hypothetical protein
MLIQLFDSHLLHFVLSEKTKVFGDIWYGCEKHVRLQSQLGTLQDSGLGFVTQNWWVSNLCCTCYTFVQFTQRRVLVAQGLVSLGLDC